MDKGKLIKFGSIALTIVGGILSLATGALEDAKLEEKIDQKLAERSDLALAEENDEEEIES